MFWCGDQGSSWTAEENLQFDAPTRYVAIWMGVATPQHPDGEFDGYGLWDEAFVTLQMPDRHTCTSTGDIGFDATETCEFAPPTA